MTLVVTGPGLGPEPAEDTIVDATIRVLPGTLTTVTVEQSGVGVRAGETTEFTVQAVDVFGNIITDATVIWTSAPNAGQITADGLFRAGTVAGYFPAGVEATVKRGGEVERSSADVLVIPGVVAEVSVVPDALSLFTGDTIGLEMAALDRFGNTVTANSVRWESDSQDGLVDGKGVSATFSAGRRDGMVTVRALVNDGSETVAGTVILDVRMGFCDTRRVTANWDAKWWMLNADGSFGPFLGASEFTGTFANDWGTGTVFAGRIDQLRLVATTRIVVQREGPVRFTLGADDGYRLFLNDEEVISTYVVTLADLFTPDPGNSWSDHGYRQSTTTLVLDPGVYNLRIDYYERIGAARLDFDVDADVIEWRAITGCNGAAVAQLSARYTMLETVDSPPEVASRFGIDQSGLLATSSSDSTSYLVPGVDKPGRHVVILQGIDSEARSGDVLESDDGVGYGIRANTFWDRATRIAREIQLEQWRRTGVVGPVDMRDILPFSYSGSYLDLGSGQMTSGSGLVDGRTYYGVYDKSFTCLGVQEAAGKLREVLNRIVDQDPAATFDLIGHSMGGMVAAYFAATNPEFADRRIHAIVTLDSPLDGAFITNPISSCASSTSAWQDIISGSSIVPAIAEISNQSTAGRVLSINSTLIGDVLAGTQGAAVGCASGDVFGLFGGHSCVWSDATALELMTDFVNS